MSNWRWCRQNICLLLLTLGLVCNIQNTLKLVQDCKRIDNYNTTKWNNSGGFITKSCTQNCFHIWAPDGILFTKKLCSKDKITLKIHNIDLKMKSLSKNKYIFGMNPFLRFSRKSWIWNALQTHYEACPQKGQRPDFSSFWCQRLRQQKMHPRNLRLYKNRRNFSTKLQSYLYHQRQKGAFINH